MNAHINLDLAVAAARTSPGEDIHAMRRDFLLINDILAGVVLKVQDSVDALSPFMSLLDQVGGRADEWILDFSVRQSREEAWYNAVLLAGQKGGARGHHRAARHQGRRARTADSAAERPRPAGPGADPQNREQ